MTNYLNIAFLFFCIGISTLCQAQKPDSLLNEITNPIESIIDTIRFPSGDGLGILNDTIFNPDPEILPYQISDDGIDSPVTYEAEDSIIYDVNSELIYLYGKAKVKQEKITLAAGEILVDYTSKTMTAKGQTDSLGNPIDLPVFSEGDQQFQSDEMSYNFETKKGKISQMVTREGDGYLRGKTVKKNEDDELFASDAFYTTCNHEHPHFKIQVNKVKVVPNKLIVSGPAQLVIADVPTPLVLPFGIFPLQKGQRSGIVFPTYGFSPNQGYYLRGGGYYFGLGQHLDLALTGDIYTNGSWRLNANSRYRKRYKYNGSVNLDYGRRKIGDPITPSFGLENNFRIQWRHTQDAKARPNSSFSANVNFGSSSFNTEYESQNQDVLTNTVTSGVTYNHSLPGTPFRLTIGATHNQNFNTGSFRLTMPSVSIFMQRIFPFKRKVQIGKQKWYEKIGLNYDAQMSTQLNTIDTLLFKENIWDDLKYGLKQNASLSTNLKVLKFFNLQPSFSYTEFTYIQQEKKEWVAETYEEIISSTGEIVTDTIPGYVNTTFPYDFLTGRTFNGRITLTTKLYGMFLFKGKRVKAIRHEITPNISFNVKPNFNDEKWGYRARITDEFGNSITDQSLLNKIGSDTLYNKFSNSVYGGPSGPQQSSLSFSLGNNFQMKYFSKKDTSQTEKKINILDRLNFSSNYNFAADSLKLGDLNIQGGSTLFKNKLQLNFGAKFDPYVVDENNRNFNKFEWGENKRIARFQSANATLSSNFSSSSKGSERASTAGTRQEKEEISSNPNAFMNYNMPWRFGVDYTLGVNKRREGDEYNTTVTQTINLDGEINLTDKWKVGFNSGYDFTNKQISRTTLDIYRDLHCWEMVFLVAPFGEYKRYEFTLRVKSSVLQDLKLTRKRFWRDLN